MNKSQSQYPVSGAGLGLRRPIADKLMADPPADVDFMEVAPENWIHVGGALGKKFRWFTERYPFVIHGLSLSIGGPCAARRAAGAGHQGLHVGARHPHVLGTPELLRR